MLKNLTDDQLWELAIQADRDGYAEPQCIMCGECSRVEPDYDGPCPECGDATIQAPGIILGVI